MEGTKKIRAFIAINPPAEWSEQLRHLQQRFRAELPGKSLKWVNPDQIHITLRFIGWIMPAEISDITRAMASCCAGRRPFQLHGGGLGTFPSPRRPRVLWVGISGELSPLVELHRRITEATREIGELPEDRPFTPHLTLARIKEFNRSEHTAMEEVLATRVELSPHWEVSDLVLMRSNLSPQGAEYESLHSEPLEG